MSISVRTSALICFSAIRVTSVVASPKLELLATAFYNARTNGLLVRAIVYSASFNDITL